jgi:hypothetical protein
MKKLITLFGFLIIFSSAFNNTDAQDKLYPHEFSFADVKLLDGRVGCHYLSSITINYAATGNIECKKQMDYMVAELKVCQDVNALKNH